MSSRLLFGSFLVFLLPGCFKVGPKTEEDVYQELIKQYDELSTLLLKVTDEPSAKDKLPRIKSIGIRLKELRDMKNQFDRAGPNPKSDELRKKYDQALSNAIRRTENQYRRLRQLVPSARDAADEVQAILQSMGVKT